MKKIKDIYSEVISKENLYRSAYLAARGRRYRDTTADFNFCLEEEIDRLHTELSAKTYRHGKYRLFTIYEPKERQIAAAPFRDRVVHHAAHDIIEPLIDRSFIHHSYACRTNKGTHWAVNRAQKFLRANAFCFHGDIRKYFPSIDHRILKQLIERRIADKDLLRLIYEIIDSAKQIAAGTIHSNGLPIGNLTSQFFANLYLNELDYFVKFDLKEKYYLRYMDDFLIFSNNKNGLFEIKEKIRDFLKERLALDLHEGKSQVYKTKSGIKFLGFRLFKDYRRLSSDNVRRFKKRLKRFEYLFEKGKIKADETANSVRAWTAHSKYANSFNLRNKILQNVLNKNEKFGALIKSALQGLA